MEEKWLIVEDFPKYEVSSCGRIRSRYKILQPDEDSKVTLYHLNDDGKNIKARKSVVNLVANAFLGNHDKTKTEIIHLDGDIKNNHVSNLIWATKEELMNNRKTSCLHGENNPNSKISLNQVQTLCKLYSEGVSVRSIIDELPIASSEIYRILRNQRWNNRTLCSKMVDQKDLVGKS